MDSKDIRRANLLLLKKRLGTWPKVADGTGTSPKYLNQIASENITAEMGDDLARRLEKAHGYDRGWMDNDHSEGVSPTRGVPVVGTLRAGPVAHYYELQYPTGHGDGWVGYNSKDENAYATKVEGDSMLPRIRPGEYVIAEPNKTYRPGDDVVVTTVKGLKMVKQFLFERDSHVTFDSINNSYERITLPRQDIEAIHYIVAITKSDSREPD